MVLSDRYGGKQRATLARRTLLYILSFGLGALLLVGVLGFTMVSIAEGLLPKPKERLAPAAASAGENKAKLGPKGTSKARPPRANEATRKGALPVPKSPL